MLKKIFIHDIISIISKYFVELKYTKFMDFVNEDKMNWFSLSRNINIIPLLEEMFKYFIVAIFETGFGYDS